MVETAPPNLQMLIITGMSGAGRSTTADVLEDLGWYVVDNLPPQMLPGLADMAVQSSRSLSHLAAVIDVRGGTFFDDLIGSVQQLRALGIDVRIMFLDASDEALVRRFESVRRPHPLQGDGRILDGTVRERIKLGELRGAADVVVDTTQLNVHQLSARINALFSQEDETSPLRLLVVSFGFKYGLPVDADHVVDVRFLPNPYWIPELRGHTGLEIPVSEYVLSQPGAEDFLQRYTAALQPVLEGYRRENRGFATIAIGCTGGKHRSVAMVQALVEQLGKQQVRAIPLHRDLGRE